MFDQMEAISFAPPLYVTVTLTVFPTVTDCAAAPTVNVPAAAADALRPAGTKSKASRTDKNKAAHLFMNNTPCRY
jgi:hypothetical protein